MELIVSKYQALAMNLVCHSAATYPIIGSSPFLGVSDLASTAEIVR